MLVAMEILPLTSASELERLLPLVAGYRTFYGQGVDDEAVRGYLPRFFTPSEDGVLLGAYPEPGAEPVGYACLHWRRSSYALKDNAYLSDLFVAEAGRGLGTGRTLLEACVAATRERGLDELQWLTGVDNRTAQRLYERFNAERSACFEYELGV